MFMLPVKSVKTPRFMFRIIILVMITGSVAGCSTVKDMKDATVRATRATVDTTVRMIPYAGGPDSGIVRKAALVPFKNETMFQQLALEKVFESIIIAYISESCTQIRLLVQGDPGFPGSLKSAEFQAGTDILSMVEKGRDAGLNAIITGGVLNLTLVREDEGILWFRETKERLHIQFSLEVFDMETGAKIYDDRFVYEIKDMAPEEIEAFKKGQPALFASLTDHLERLAKNTAPKICSAIMAHPWTGYVVSVENGRVDLSFGKNIGIRRGNVLEVHDNGRIVENVMGQQFIMPGKKIGEIRITDLDGKAATGEIISGENIQAGNPVKLKK